QGQPEAQGHDAGASAAPLGAARFAARMEYDLQARRPVQAAAGLNLNKGETPCRSIISPSWSRPLRDLLLAGAGTPSSAKPGWAHAAKARRTAKRASTRQRPRA